MTVTKQIKTNFRTRITDIIQSCDVTHKAITLQGKTADTEHCL